MTSPTLPPDVEERLQAFADKVEDIWHQIVLEQETLIANWAETPRPSRAQRLQGLELHVKALTAEAEAVMRANLEGLKVAYEAGAWSSAFAAGEGVAFTMADVDAITILIQDTMDDMLAATQYMRASTKDLVRTVARDWMSTKLVKGETAEAMARRMAEDLADRGIAAIVYKNGTRVGLSQYSEMVMRTKSAVAYQQGGFQQGRRLGIEWWEILDGPECGLSYHEDPTLADGLIVPLDMAEEFPISHPNCVRVTTPRPDLSNPEDVKAASRLDPDALRENMRQADAARLAAASKLASSAATKRATARARVNGVDYRDGAISPAQARHMKRTQR